jgi:hypothetical protein
MVNMQRIKDSGHDSRNLEFEEISRSGVFRMHTHANCAESFKLLAGHDLRPVDYKEILAMAYGSSRRALRFRNSLRGDSFYINGFGIDEFGEYCTFSRIGELLQIGRDVPKSDYGIDNTVFVYQGYMPLVMSVYSDRFAKLKGYRFDIDGDASPAVKEHVILGIKNDGKLNEMFSILLRN